MEIGHVLELTKDGSVNSYVCIEFVYELKGIEVACTSLRLTFTEVSFVFSLHYVFPDEVLFCCSFHAKFRLTIL